MLALGIIGLVGTVVLWLISKRHNQEVNSGDNGNKKLFYTEMILLIAATLFFGGRIVYSAVPYHGALSWKLDEWMRKKEVELEHNNLFEDGVEGILMDLDEALQLPEELYIANKYQVSFDENGTIQRIYAFKSVPLFLTVIRLDLIGISGIFDRLNCILDALSACFFYRIQ